MFYKFKNSINFFCAVIFVLVLSGCSSNKAIKEMKKLGAKKVICFAVHGIFVENALQKLQKAGATVITTNTIPNKVGKIDVSGLISKNFN